MNIKETKQNIILAGRKAVDELIKVAEEKIVTGGEDDVSVDRLKNAAATKKLAIFDAFEILSRIEAEENMLNDTKPKLEKKESFGGFAEGRANLR
jgi:ASC-1-like (ASCH) protein